MKKICFLVPAHNEETVIGHTLESLLKVAPATDIYVVDDGSTDATQEKASQYTPHVLVLRPNMGKARAINTAVKSFALARKYEYIMPVDADTVITPQFIKNALPVLENDKPKNLACVVGRVVGTSHNWLTCYRVWEYEIAQTIHKAAQGKINAIIVCPGCSTIYRTRILAQIGVPTGTLTEDMDFTFELHRGRHGQIAFAGHAVVVTQDPHSLKDFLKQIDRWYTGFWQCLAKHHLPWRGQTLDAEVALLATEGLFNGLLVLSLIFFVPYAIVYRPSLLLYPLALDLALFMIPTLVWVAVKYRLGKIFFYLPAFYLVRGLSSLVFLRSFVKVVFALDLKMTWGKVFRYQPS